MTAWAEALAAAEEALSAPLHEGFNTDVFAALGPIPEELAEQALRVVELIGDRITRAEAAAGATLTELSWTRDRMHELPQTNRSPVYLDLTA